MIALILQLWQMVCAIDFCIFNVQKIKTSIAFRNYLFSKQVFYQTQVKTIKYSQIFIFQENIWLLIFLKKEQELFKLSLRTVNSFLKTFLITMQNETSYEK